jgi:hypothetical protein
MACRFPLAGPLTANKDLGRSPTRGRMAGRTISFWWGYTVVGRTPLGRALVAAFDLNQPRRVLIRDAEESFDLFPP